MLFRSSHRCSFRHFKIRQSNRAPGERLGTREYFFFNSHLSSNTFPIFDFYSDYSKIGNYRQLLYRQKTIFRCFVHFNPSNLVGIHNFFISVRNFLPAFMHSFSTYANVSVKYSKSAGFYPCTRLRLRRAKEPGVWPPNG